MIDTRNINISLSRVLLDALKLFQKTGSPEIANKVMLSLGGFEFLVGKKSYEKLTSKTSYRWTEIKLINSPSVSSYTGEDLREIELEGTIIPALIGKKGVEAMDSLRTMAKDPLLMVDGLGKNHGKFVILDITEDLSAFTVDGIPQRISFKIRLRSHENSE